MKKLVFAICAVIMLAGCASKNKIVAEQSLPDIYDEAYTEFNKEHYDALLGIKNIENIENNH